MTSEEFNQVVEYLRDPRRQALIEVELPTTSRTRFETIYNGLTGGHPLPANTNTAPYYIWPAGANKWGIELRLYFISDNEIPAQLAPYCVNNNRHGYEQYDKRINNNDFIFFLFERGFVLGRQVHGRIH